MAILKCKMCGGDLNIAEGVSVCECEYCGTKQTVPTADNEKKLNLFNRATRLRINGEFDKAAALYESLVAEFPEEAEAYWGLVICHYGIEYVDDPATGNKIPTCHRASFDPIAGDDNFRMAMEYADVMAQKVYRDEAREIDRIREEILSVCKDEKPYDIFICYKESDDKGGRTIDSVIAQDAYDALTAKGYRVFFARISLEDKLGSQYEPFIFSALNSARIMLVFGTKYEYFHAVWVKNEWSRFLKLMTKDKSKVLIPCYKDMDAYDMPDEFHALQAQDMGKVGAMQDLLRGVEKILGADKTVVQETIVVGGNPQIAPLLERVFLFLEDGEWAKADELCEQVLNQNPKCGEAYLGKLMAEMHIRTREDLKDCSQPFNNYNNYQKAMRFGDEALQTELQGYIDHIIERNLKAVYDSAVAVMKAAHNTEDYVMATKQLQALGDYADAAQLAEKCMEKAEIIHKDTVYRQATSYTNAQNADIIQQAITLFQSIPGWKDADEQLRICQEKLKEIQKAEEEKRIEAQRRAKEEALRQVALRKKRVRRNLWILGISIIVILLWIFAIHPWISYASGNYRIYINRYNIEEFTISDGVTEIEDGAFRDCDDLTSITIPDGVTAIGERAFAGCGALKTVEIPDSVTTIGDGAFSACISLESVTIGNGVTSIGEDAFAHCNTLTTVTVNSQAVINSGCFPNLPNLKSVIIGSGVTSIEDSAFYNCAALTSVTIPNSVTSIGDGAFSTCISLKSVTIPSSVTSIGEDAFAYCGALSSVTIPDGITSIKNYMFYDCDALTSITIPNSVTSIGDRAFSSCDALTSVTIGSGVTSIGNYAFYNCDILTSITIPDSVTSIGNYAIYNCDALTSVTIPDSVVFIGHDAFMGCAALTDVYFTGSINQWNDLFVSFESSVTVHCSDGTTQVD